jgi:toxin ParE1/3/4
MKLVFDTKALSDIEDIYHWISRDSPSIAKTVVNRVFQSIERLASFPQMGRTGLEPGTREWVVPRLPYIVVYELNDLTDELAIIAIFHGAQDRE